MLLRHREINDEAIGYIKNIFFDPRTSIKEFDELESASRNNAFSILKLARDAQLDGGFFR